MRLYSQPGVTESHTHPLGGPHQHISYLGRSPWEDVRFRLAAPAFSIDSTRPAFPAHSSPMDTPPASLATLSCLTHIAFRTPAAPAFCHDILAQCPRVHLRAIISANELICHLHSLCGARLFCPVPNKLERHWREAISNGSVSGTLDQVDIRVNDNIIGACFVLVYHQHHRERTK